MSDQFTNDLKTREELNEQMRQLYAANAGPMVEAPYDWFSQPRVVPAATAETIALTTPAFVPFPKLARLSRDMIVTEKLDGTNAQVHITDEGRVIAGSRNRWITAAKGNDNAGFARWVDDHADELRALGPGSHFGEWWGAGIQRGYDLTEKRFSLFNVGRWNSEFNRTATPQLSTFPADGASTACNEVPCCHVVPILLRWTFDTDRVDMALSDLESFGSYAAPGFMQPEGIVVFHTKADVLFKKTLDKNDNHKAAA